MSWAVGGPDDYGRWYGYGVPATCDHPGCGEGIDRGLAHACGDGVMGRDDNCGLYFCGKHLSYREAPEDERMLAYCERCNAGAEPFEPTPETAEWLTHILTDESWQQWREERPNEVAAAQAQLPAHVAGPDAAVTP